MSSHPGEVLFRVDQYVKSTITASEIPSSTTEPKKTWNKLSNEKISSVEDGATRSLALLRLLVQTMDALKLQTTRVNKLQAEVSVLKTTVESFNAQNVKSYADSVTESLGDYQTKIETLKTDILQSVGSTIDQKLSALLSSWNVNNHVSQSSYHASSTPPSSSTSSSARYPPDATEVIVISLPSEPAKKTTTCEKISENLADVQVKFMNFTEDKVVIGFPNADEKKKGIANTTQLAAEETEVTVTPSEKSLPKLTVRNVPKNIFGEMDLSAVEADLSVPANKLKMEQLRDQQKAKIIELILKKNPGVKTLVDAGHTLQVVFIQCDRALRKYYTFALKVSPAIRNQLINSQSGRLYIGNESFPFHDRFYYKVCFHCQGLSHVSSQCPNRNEDPVCLYCSDSHKSSTCPVKKVKAKHCCAICVKSDDPKIVKEARTHNTAASDICPVQQKIINNIYKKTDFLSTKPM